MRTTFSNQISKFYSSILPLVFITGLVLQSACGRVQVNAPLTNSSTEPAKTNASLMATSGDYGPNTYSIVDTDVYKFNTALPTAESYDLSSLASEFGNQVVAVTGQLSYAGSTPKFIGHIQFKTGTNPDQNAPIVAQYLVVSLEDGSKPRVILNPDLILSPPASKNIDTITGDAETLQDFNGKKFVAFGRIQKSKGNSATLKAARMKQVPIATGGCSYESSRFRTVPEGCLVDEKRIYWTGLELPFSVGADGALPYFNASDLTNPSQPILSTSLPDVVVKSVSLPLMQLYAGYTTPFKDEWISYLDSVGKSADHLFKIPLNGYGKEIGSPRSMNIWLRDNTNIIGQKPGGNIFAAKATVNSRVLPGSWNSKVGSFGPSALVNYGTPTLGEGKPYKETSLRLYDSEAAQNGSVRAYISFPKLPSAATNKPRSIGLVARYGSKDPVTTAANRDSLVGYVTFDGKDYYVGISGFIQRPIDGRIAGGNILLRAKLPVANPGAELGGLLELALNDLDCTLTFTNQTDLVPFVLKGGKDACSAGGTLLAQEGLVGIRTEIPKDTFDASEGQPIVTYSAFSVMKGPNTSPKPKMPSNGKW